MPASQFRQRNAPLGKESIVTTFVSAYVKTLGQLDTEFGIATVVAERLADNHIEIRLEDQDGLTMGVVSTNPHRCNTADNEFLMKETGDGETFFYALLATGLFIDTGRRVHRGFLSSPVWAIKDEVLVPRTRTRQVCALLRA